MVQFTFKPIVHHRNGSSLARCSHKKTCAAIRLRKHDLVCTASAQSSKLMSEAQTKYQAGDRFGALQLWEQALRHDPDIEERKTALYNSTAVYASAGDLELAKMTLREAIQLGLDFQATSQGQGSPGCVDLRASQQVLIQLRKFNEATLKAMSTPSTPGTYKGKVVTSAKSLSEIFDSEEVGGVDTSIAGVATRVALVLVALSALGVLLFRMGLQFAFPEGQ